MDKRAYNYGAVGERVRKARIAQGFTQEYVAQRCGVGSKQISMIETGQSGISITTLIPLCHLLHVSSDYILFGNNNLPPSPAMELLRHFTPAQEEKALELLRIYAEANSG